MKKLNLIFLMLISMRLYAQDDSAIKLFVYQAGIIKNNSNLSPGLQDRLFRKTTQLINQTGIAELGYSSFLVSPKFSVINISKSETGTLTVYLAQCELTISIERRNINDKDGAVFASFTKTITGSGMNENEAANNALNNISPSDTRIVDFLTDSKKKNKHLFSNTL